VGEWVGECVSVWVSNYYLSGLYFYKNIIIFLLYFYIL